MTSTELLNHQYRNAIAPAVTSLGILKRHQDKLSPEQIKHYIATIGESIARATSFVEGNIDFVGSINSQVKWQKY